MPSQSYDLDKRIKLESPQSIYALILSLEGEIFRLKRMAKAGVEFGFGHLRTTDKATAASFGLTEEEARVETAEGSLGGLGGLSGMSSGAAEVEAVRSAIEKYFGGEDLSEK